LFVIDACRIRSGGGVVHALQIIESAILSGLPFVAYVSDEIYSASNDKQLSSGNLRRCPPGFFSFFWQLFFLPIIVGFNKRLITLDSASVCPVSSFIAVHQDLYAFEYESYQKKSLSKVFFVKFFNKFTLRRAQKCVFQTKHAYDVVSNLVKIRDYAIIPHGPNPSFNNFVSTKKTSDGDYNGLSNKESSSPIKLLSVGPFFPYKDYLYVLEALALLRDDGFNFSYTIVGGVGDENYYEEVKEKINNLNLSLHVKLVGNCSLSQVKSYYINSDIMIFSSLCETFGITILEALQFKLPIIANDTSSNREILLNNGIFYNSDDLFSLKSILENVLTAANLPLIASSQYENLERFSWESSTKDFWNYVSNK